VKIIIAGGGEAGEELAEALIKEKHEVIIIEKDKRRAEELASKLDCMVINNDASNPKALMDVGVKEADTLIAATGNDKDNIIIALIALQLGVRNIIVKINDPDYIQILSYMNINNIVNPGRLVTLQILSMLKGLNLLNVSVMFRGNVRFYTHIISHGQAGLKLKDLGLEYDKAWPLLILRGENAILPGENVEFKENDQLLLVIKAGDFESVVAKLRSLGKDQH
jgi:trk system potassium uptake protein TrkA